jgi:hypothetical protein
MLLLFLTFFTQIFSSEPCPCESRPHLGFLYESGSLETGLLMRGRVLGATSDAVTLVVDQYLVSPWSTLDEEYTEGPGYGGEGHGEGGWFETIREATVYLGSSNEAPEGCASPDADVGMAALRASSDNSFVLAVREVPSHVVARLSSDVVPANGRLFTLLPCVPVLELNNTASSYDPELLSILERHDRLTNTYAPAGCRYFFVPETATTADVDTTCLWSFQHMLSRTLSVGGFYEPNGLVDVGFDAAVRRFASSVDIDPYPVRDSVWRRLITTLRDRTDREAALTLATHAVTGCAGACGVDQYCTPGGCACLEVGDGECHSGAAWAISPGFYGTDAGERVANDLWLTGLERPVSFTARVAEPMDVHVVVAAFPKVQPPGWQRDASLAHRPLVYWQSPQPIRLAAGTARYSVPAGPLSFPAATWFSVTDGEIVKGADAHSTDLRVVLVDAATLDASDHTPLAVSAYLGLSGPFRLGQRGCSLPSGQVGLLMPPRMCSGSLAAAVRDGPGSVASLALNDAEVCCDTTLPPIDVPGQLGEDVLVVPEAVFPAQVGAQFATVFLSPGLTAVHQPDEDVKKREDSVPCNVRQLTRDGDESVWTETIVPCENNEDKVMYVYLAFAAVAVVLLAVTVVAGLAVLATAAFTSVFSLGVSGTVTFATTAALVVSLVYDAHTYGGGPITCSFGGVNYGMSSCELQFPLGGFVEAQFVIAPSVESIDTDDYLAGNASARLCSSLDFCGSAVSCLFNASHAVYTCRVPLRSSDSLSISVDSLYYLQGSADVTSVDADATVVATSSSPQFRVITRLCELGDASTPAQERSTGRCVEASRCDEDYVFASSGANTCVGDTGDDDLVCCGFRDGEHSVGFRVAATDDDSSSSTGLVVGITVGALACMCCAALGLAFIASMVLKQRATSAKQARSLATHSARHGPRVTGESRSRSRSRSHRHEY